MIFLFTSGCPGAGKTTWCRNFVAENTSCCYLVSSDDVRKSLGLVSNDLGEHVYRECERRILSSKAPIILFDSTNLSCKRWEWISSIVEQMKKREENVLVCAVVFDRDFDYLSKIKQKRINEKDEKGSINISNYYDMFREFLPLRDKLAEKNHWLIFKVKEKHPHCVPVVEEELRKLVADQPV